MKQRSHAYFQNIKNALRGLHSREGAVVLVVDTAVLRRLFGAYLLLAAAGSLRQLRQERRRK